MDKTDKAMMTNLKIVPNAATAPVVASGSRHSVDRRIRAFLNGESQGEDVLNALYGSVADEPVPERLRTLLQR